MKIENLNVDEVILYTNLTISDEDVTITLRNVPLEIMDRFTNKKFVINDLFCTSWYMFCCYNDVVLELLEIKVKILVKTKKKIELLVIR